MLKKSIVTMTTVAVVGLSSTFLTGTAYAERSASQISNERSEIKADLSDAEAKIADALIELKDLEKQIKQVDDALADNEKQMKDTKDKIASTKKEVDKLEKEIVKLEDEIEKRYEILRDRIVSYQKSGGDIGYLEVIFGSKDFGDFISRVSAVSKIADSDTDLMKEQEEAKAELEKKQDKVKKKLDGLNEMKVELEGMQELIIEQREQNEKKKEELKEKVQDLKDLKAELKIKDNNLAAIQAEVDRSVSDDQSSSDGGKLTQLSSKSSSKPVASGNLSTAINAGYKYLGVPYVWGGGSPSGFDCSGFVSWAFGQAGISIPSSTAALQSTGSRVSYSNIQPGDLVFFNTYKTNGHVGIYVGGGKFIGSQNSTGLAVADMTSGYWKNHFAGHVRRVR
ncbi:NlpC/P60 family protein [Virgibacillus ndiopensis]|uniref:C40 family peptidase n=1 Tax=Virgibacillus ndiopensis TaxID=2004408 RepID=UPI000C086686|nr:C40 family peptidase [Virgibacillus ndiopensis]